MKKLAYILSLVVVVLSLAPCCAMEDHIKQTTAEIGLTQQNTQDDNCCQECSPFYTCGTCNGFMALPIIGFNIPFPSLTPTHFNSAYLQSFADGITSNIWQPPKLS